jgi:hypothetical protein
MLWRRVDRNIFLTKVLPFLYISVKPSTGAGRQGHVRSCLRECIQTREGGYYGLSLQLACRNIKQVRLPPSVTKSAPHPDGDYATALALAGQLAYFFGGEQPMPVSTEPQPSDAPVERLVNRYLTAGCQFGSIAQLDLLTSRSLRGHRSCVRDLVPGPV